MSGILFNSQKRKNLQSWSLVLNQSQYLSKVINTSSSHRCTK
uniref:Uncharacterized protein n=1 Tax=Rhizophora mucronata TaxID=61149 RepID=A0A2P2MZW1_RHIMU